MDSDQGNNKWCLDDNIMSRAIPEKIQQGGVSGSWGYGISRGIKEVACGVKIPGLN